MSAIPEAREYKTRYYDVTDVFFDKEPYPTELTDVADGQLTPIYCTRTYSYDYNKNYFSSDESTNKIILLTDPDLLTYIQSIATMYEGKHVREIYTCAPKEGKTIVVYSLGPCGGGCSGQPHIGIVNNIGEIKETGKMIENMPYFGCRKPLQLTNGNDFYFRCGGGDGPGGSGSIYRLSLNTLTTSMVRHCESGIDEFGKSYSRCQ